MLDLLFFFHLIKVTFLVFQLPAISDNGANRKFYWDLNESVSRKNTLFERQQFLVTLVCYYIFALIFTNISEIAIATETTDI